MKKESKINKRISISANIMFGIFFFVAFFVMIFYLFGQNMTAFDIFGRQYFSIASGSMEPTLKVGSVIVVEKVQIEDIEVDDIITYVTVIEGKEFFVTHRVVKITDRGLVTHGDANPTIDRELVTVENFVGRMVKKSWLLSSITGLLRTRLGVVFLIHIPMVFFLAYEVFKLIDIGYEVKEENHKNRFFVNLSKNVVARYDFFDINIVYNDTVMVYEIDEGNGGKKDPTFSRDFIKGKRQRFVDESKLIVYPRAKAEKLIIPNKQNFK